MRCTHSRHLVVTALAAILAALLSSAAGAQDVPGSDEKPAAPQLEKQPETQLEKQPAPLIAPPSGRKEPLPEALEGVGLDDRIGAKIPLDAEFLDEYGEKVKLGDYFDGRRPVMITLNYFRCPMLCGLQLNALVNGGEAARAEGRTSGLMGLDWTPGQEFVLLTVSFDALEKPPLARKKKQNYMALYERPAAEKGWHFLTGQRHNIEALTTAAGFNMKWNAERREYAHPPVFVVCTPDGTISQYLTGFVYESDDIKDALTKAGRGETGTFLHQVALFTCFVYNPEDGSYAADAMKIMRLGGFLIVALVGFYLIKSWRRTAG